MFQALKTQVESRVQARHTRAALLSELGVQLGGPAREAANLAPRHCPVCDGDDHEPAATVEGRVYAFHRCRGCSLLYAPRLLKPSVLRKLVVEKPGLRELWLAYWEHMRADAEAQRGQTAHAPLIARLRAALPPASFDEDGRPRTVIDVGCGFGKLLSELALAFREAIGLELDRRTAQEGQRLFGVPIRTEALEKLARPAGSVDLIVMNQILEHLGDVRSVVDAAHRLLRPGGVLYVSIPQGASLGLRVRGAGHLSVATHKHVNLFTAEALRRLAERCHFAVAELKSDDVLDLSAADWILERVHPPHAALLSAPAFAVDKALQSAVARLRILSRFGAGAHLEAVLRKPA